MRRAALLLVALLLAGCNGGAPPPATTTLPAEPPARFQTIGIDGHWPIPLDASRAAAVRAGHPDDGIGAMIRGEAALGPLATTFAAMDATAARLLEAPAPPEPGTVILSRNASARLGVGVGDEVEARAAGWPASHVIAPFEMEIVRACDPAEPAVLCSLPPSASGEATLLLRIPAGSSRLQFHADVVELRAGDYPAFWNGTFVAPDGTTTPFATAALDRATVLPPGAVEGDLQPGQWTVRFTIEANHTRLPGAIAGFITFRTLGFGSFDTELLRISDAKEQTRALLANATPARRALRVAGIADAPGVGALLAMDDARALLSLGEGRVTALVVATRDADLAGALLGESDPALAALRARPLRDPAPTPAPSGALALWAPPDLDLAALPPVDGAGAPALAVASWAPLAPPVVKGKPLATGASLWSLPIGPLPWRLAAGGYWKDEAALVPGFAGSPHLVLASADVAQAAGVAPTNATYLEMVLETGLGPRTAFGMGAVEGGPPASIWASAALVNAVATPRGARLLVPLDGGADRAAVEAAALEAWGAFGVAALG